MITLNILRTDSRFAAAMAMAPIAILASSAQALDLTNNLANATAARETASGNRWLAASFGTGSAAHTLNSVTLLLANITPGTASLSVYSNGGLEPGSLVGTLTSPASYSSSLAQTTFTSSGMALAANSTYWVVLTPASGEFDWAWTSDNSGSGVGFQHTWGVSDDAGAVGSWWSYDIYQTQFRVVVDVTPCTGDINGSNSVDVDDLLAVIGAWGPCAAPCPPNCAADVAPNCAVNVDDLLAVITAWGPCQ